MCSIEGNIKKMISQLGDVVQYQLPVGTEFVAMNQLIGKNIQLQFLDEINCLSCGTSTTKSFGQGYCYKCFITVPETSDCVLRPELCEAHLCIA